MYLGHQVVEGLLEIVDARAHVVDPADDLIAHALELVLLCLPRKVTREHREEGSEKEKEKEKESEG